MESKRFMAAPWNGVGCFQNRLSFLMRDDKAGGVPGQHHRSVKLYNLFELKELWNLPVESRHPPVTCCCNQLEVMAYRCDDSGRSLGLVTDCEGFCKSLTLIRYVLRCSNRFLLLDPSKEVIGRIETPGE
jgi:hypothetical protein